MGDEAVVKCPKCADAVLEAIKAGEADVHRCAACGGIWFNFSELETVLKIPSGLTKVDRRPVDPTKDQMKANCPECHTPMIKIKALGHADVTMDGCKVCYGRWLDGGELAKLKGGGLWAKLKSLLGN